MGGVRRQTSSSTKPIIASQQSEATLVRKKCNEKLLCYTRTSKIAIKLLFTAGREMFASLVYFCLESQFGRSGFFRNSVLCPFNFCRHRRSLLKRRLCWSVLNLFPHASLRLFKIGPRAKERKSHYCTLCLEPSS